MKNLRSFYTVFLISMTLFFTADIANFYYREISPDIFSGFGLLIFNALFSVKYMAALMFSLPDNYSLQQLVMGLTGADIFLLGFDMTVGYSFIQPVYIFGVQAVFILLQCLFVKKDLFFFSERNQSPGFEQGQRKAIKENITALKYE